MHKTVAHLYWSSWGFHFQLCLNPNKKGCGSAYVCGLLLWAFTEWRIITWYFCSQIIKPMSPPSDKDFLSSETSTVAVSDPLLLSSAFSPGTCARFLLCWTDPLLLPRRLFADCRGCWQGGRLYCSAWSWAHSRCQVTLYHYACILRFPGSYPLTSS